MTISSIKQLSNEIATWAREVSHTYRKVILCPRPGSEITEGLMKFSDLEFIPHPAKSGGIQAKKDFPNGFSVSVIKTPFSYGGAVGLYEKPEKQAERD